MKKKLQELKQSHPKARHFVVAYRYLNDLKQVVKHSSDDGEPKGTSGKPTLMVLQGADIINCAIITVRYFGGTKLGTGGLVRAYSEATNLVIGTSVLLVYKERIMKTITFEYSNIRILEYECNECSIDIVTKGFSDTTQYILESDVQSMTLFLTRVDRLVTIL